MHFSKTLVIFHSTCIYLGFVLSIPFIYGQSEVEVKLITTGDFIERGSNIILQCKHNVDPKVLYKVAWLKNCADIGKFFEFIVDRIPPFRNFTIPGAEIDWSNTSNEQVALKNIDFEFSGLYYCEVTTSTPIYTKASQDRRIRVILSQAASPKISFSKRIYHVGEKLQANCTTSKAHPLPSITWLINGKKVDDKYVRQLHPSTNSAKNSHRSKSHQQQKQQQQQKEHNNISTNSFDSKKIPKNMTRIKKNKHVHHQQNVRHDHNFEYNNYYNHHQNNHRFNRMINDNNYLDTNRKVSLFNHKYRRHVDEDNFPDTISYNNNNSYDDNNNNNSSFDKIEGNITSTSSITTTNINVSSSNTTSSSSSSFSNTTKQYINRGNISISQINIEVSELYVGEKDKLEITCLATIPAHINDGEQFVDYKTYSVKVNVAKAKQSSSISSMSEITAFGNSSISTSVHKNSILLSAISFIILKF